MTASTEPKYDITVEPKSGDAFHVLAATQRGLRQAGAPEEEVKAYYAEATSGDYDHLLEVTMRWVNL
jgi:hypothetical protein